MRPGQILLRQTLPGQFLFAGGAVMTVAALFVGLWVSHRIEQGVVQNTAVSAAYFMDSFIAPVRDDLAASDEMSPESRASIRRLFTETPLSERVASYKIWKPGGLIIEASDHDLVGRTFEPSEDLKLAWTGKIAASFEDLNDLEDEKEAALGVPLLEVYSPIRELWTGRVIAVAEFYERAEQLDLALSDARRKSWLIVAAVFASSGLLLFGIVQAGGRTIERQQRELQAQLAETRRVSEQNRALRDRIVSAARRSTGQADRVMQRIGRELHDGVAQHLSLASLRMSGDAPPAPEDASTVRRALDAAMTELRAISRGLALPDLKRLTLGDCVTRAADDHNKAFRAAARIGRISGGAVDPPYPLKLCVYRFVQEALSNAYRHAEASDVRVDTEAGPGEIVVTVADDGRGFDPDRALLVREDGGQGLLGLSDRAATLGGTFEIRSAPGQGAALTLRLPYERETK